MSYGTPFVETEALLAAQDGNTDRLHQLLGDMLPSERTDLQRTCVRLAEQIDAHDA